MLTAMATSLYVAYVSLPSADQPVPTDFIGNLLQYGVLGLVVVGFITGWIIPGHQAKALAAENTRLSGLIEGKLFPMLEQYATTMEKAAMALEKAAEAMDRQAERDRIQQDRVQRQQDAVQIRQDLTQREQDRARDSG
jgi:hypothetical protein